MEFFENYCHSGLWQWQAASTYSSKHCFGNNGFSCFFFARNPDRHFDGANKRIEAFVNPIFLTLRPIPPLAWIPLAIVWLGLGNSAKVMVIYVAAFVPAVINTFTGVKSIEAPQREAAAMLGIDRLTYYREVLIPGAMPLIFTGLRLSLQASWTTLVAAELVGATLGLGSILNQAAQDINPAMILVGMISVAISGWLMTQILAKAERYAMPWRS